MTWLGHCRAGEGQGMLELLIALAPRWRVTRSSPLLPRMLGKRAGARSLGPIRRAAAHLRAGSGSRAPDTLAILANLAHWTGMAGDRAGARDQLTALLPIREPVLGPEHPDTLTTRTSLGDGVPERHTHLTCESLHRTDPLMPRRVR
jgi:hypothetical protein